MSIHDYYNPIVMFSPKYGYQWMYLIYSNCSVFTDMRYLSSC